jgi:3-dehydroquinate synthase
MEPYPIHIGPDALEALAAWLALRRPTGLLLLCDTETHRYCYPLAAPHLPPHQTVVIPAGEAHKTLATCGQVWAAMTAAELDRQALVLNLGGGVIGDLGGFAAGTYKRGIGFVQLPTTLLSQVDASVGGKLGVDFQGLKNHIGIFRNPEGVFMLPDFLRTLPQRELRSGFAEVIKHCLIADAEAWDRLQDFRPEPDTDWAPWIRHSVEVKSRIVAADPQERGLRKALNFGHTVGHAVESWFLDTPDPLTHGEAIAAGMCCEAWISAERGLIGAAELDAVTALLLRHYGKVPLDPGADAELWRRMRNDKKNTGGQVQAALLRGIGAAATGEPVTEAQALAALAWYRSLGK